jgi:hypothetical protein
VSQVQSLPWEIFKLSNISNSYIDSQKIRIHYFNVIINIMRTVAISKFALLFFISALFFKCIPLEGSQPGDAKAKVVGIQKCDTLLSFLSRNTPKSGITIQDVKSWYSPADVQSIKNAYPVPKGDRRGKIVVYESDPKDREADYFKLHPEYLKFYEESAALKKIAERMRQQILESLPQKIRDDWAKKKFGVSVQWSDGSESLLYDHAQHVHRDHIVASLCLDGAGTIVKLGEDVSHLDYKQVYQVADPMPGYIYQAGKRELVILNAVHHPEGGLHAAPQANQKYPERFVILVSIDK